MSFNAGPGRAVHVSTKKRRRAIMQKVVAFDIFFSGFTKWKQRLREMKRRDCVGVYLYRPIYYARANMEFYTNDKCL